MPIATVSEINENLIRAFGGYLDRRLVGTTHSADIMLDVPTSGDTDTRGVPFAWFCYIAVQVETPSLVRLNFAGGTPLSKAVRQWFLLHDASRNGDSIEIFVRPDNVDDLLILVRAMREITRVKYAVPAYKYVVPRVMKSLNKLHKVLRKCW